MKKKLLSIILVLVMVLSLLPAAALAEEETLKIVFDLTEYTGEITEGFTVGDTTCSPVPGEVTTFTLNPDDMPSGRVRYNTADPTFWHVTGVKEGYWVQASSGITSVFITDTDTSASNRYMFVRNDYTRFYGNFSAAEILNTLDGDTITITYVPPVARYSFSVTSSDESAGTVSFALAGNDGDADLYQLTAAPLGDALFFYWQKDGTEERITDNPATVRITEDASYTGYFDSPNHTPTVTPEFTRGNDALGEGSQPVGTGNRLEFLYNTDEGTVWKFTLGSLGESTIGVGFDENCLQLAYIQANDDESVRYYSRDGKTVTWTETGDTAYTAYYEPRTLHYAEGTFAYANADGGTPLTEGEAATFTLKANTVPGHGYRVWTNAGGGKYVEFPVVCSLYAGETAEGEPFASVTDMKQFIYASPDFDITVPAESMPLTDKVTVALQLDNRAIKTYTFDVEVTPAAQPAGPAAQIVSASLTLAGDIGVNFFVIPNDELLADEGAYAQLTAKGETGEPIMLADLTPDNDGRFCFTQFVAAKEMTEQITLAIYTADGTAVALTDAAGSASDGVYSVARFVRTAAEVGSDKLQALAVKLASYGAYAKAYFEYEPVAEDTEYMDAIAGDITGDITVETVTPYKPVKDASTDAFKAKSISLVLKSETILKVTFAGTDVAQYTFTVDGEPVSAVKSGSSYVVKIPNIAAQDLDKAYTIVATNGDSTYTISAYALTYAYQVLKAEDRTDAIRDLVKALYEYNQAANAYFSAAQDVIEDNLPDEDLDG